MESSNYVKDRSRDFKHQMPEGVVPPPPVSAHDYVQMEKNKQMSKLRDWHLEARGVRQTDTISLRSSFTNLRQHHGVVAQDKPCAGRSQFLIASVVVVIFAALSASFFFH